MVFIIALIFALRIFSFMAILPVITSAAVIYSGYSVLMVGLVIGVYGLLQACLHIPMGYFSDKFGRKRVVILGLLLMFFGGVIAAITTSIYGLLLGRAIQGSGAIGSVLNAWCADITSEAERTKAMALIGITIGVTFFLSLMLGPYIVGQTSLSGLFWLSAILALIAMFLVILLPEPAELTQAKFQQQIKTVITDKILLQLDYGVFAVHASYTALFLLIPSWVNAYVGSAVNAWHLYLPILMSALILSLPVMFFAEARGKIRLILLLTASLLFLSHIILFIHGNSWFFALFLYFLAFTVLEALLPSLLSKIAPSGHKGTAMGVFSCAQYLGIFAGGSLGGWILHNFDANFVICLGGLFSFIWLLVSVRLPVLAIKN